jgi:hypothetical protein
VPQPTTGSQRNCHNSCLPQRQPNKQKQNPKSILVEGEGFEPSKAEPSDLQSDPFDRSGTPPNRTRDYAYHELPCQTDLACIGAVGAIFLQAWAVSIAGLLIQQSGPVNIITSTRHSAVKARQGKTQPGEYAETYFVREINSWGSRSGSDSTRSMMVYCLPKISATYSSALGSRLMQYA